MMYFPMPWGDLWRVALQVGIVAGAVVTGGMIGARIAEPVVDILDGADRGLIFAFVGAHLGRQFEFVQSEWVNGGEFIGLGDARDPVTGAADGEGRFSIPRKPIPRRLDGLPRFVVTRGGEYCFLPSLSALRWLSELP